MAYNYSVDEETIPRKYAEHNWSDNVIISDSRMTSIEKGIVNLYNTIFGVEEEIDDNGVTQVEKITSIFDDFKNTVIGDDLSEPHNNTIFDNIAKLWHNIEDESNLDENEQEISRTPYGRIVDLENHLGPAPEGATNKNTAFDRITDLETRLGPAPQDETNKNTAFDQIAALTNSLGTQGTNQSAFTEINTIKSNLGTRVNGSAFNEIESAKGRITTLETNLGPAPQDAENKNTAFDRIETLENNKNTAFDRINVLETNLGQPNSENNKTVFQHIASLKETLEDTVREETDKVLLKTTFKLTLPYLTASILTKEKEYKIRLLDINYPIGSIYMSLNNADPKDILGGKWISISQGRVLLGAGNNISDGTTTKSFTVGSTGGKYEHVLTQKEMPAHSHQIYYVSAKGSTPKVPSLTISTNTKKTSKTSPILNAGENKAHNNIQPYLVCNIWQRVIEDIHDVMRAMDSGTYTHLFNEGNEVPLIIDDNTTIIMVIDQIDEEHNHVYFRQKYIEGMEPCSNSAIDSNLAAFQNSIPDDIKLALVNSPTLPTETPLDGVEVWTTSNQGDTEAQHYLLPRICLKTIDMGVSSNVVDAEDSGHSF